MKKTIACSRLNQCHCILSVAMLCLQKLLTLLGLRQSKYLNNIIEQDHRNVKRIVKPMMGFQSFNTARRTVREIEAMNIMHKGQVKGISRGHSVSQAEFINEIFGVSV